MVKKTVLKEVQNPVNFRVEKQKTSPWKGGSLDYAFAALNSFNFSINCGTTSKASPTIP